MNLTYSQRSLLNSLHIRYPFTKAGKATVWNARPNYVKVSDYRALEREGYLTITEVHNVATENMLYARTAIEFTLTDKEY